MKASYKSIKLAIGLFLALSASVSAAPGDLDLSFGSGGIVLTDFGGPAYYDVARTGKVQPDGKIVVCGQFNFYDSGESGLFLARYHPTGALDDSFGTNGKIISPINQSIVVGCDIALQPDGKIIAVGNGFGSRYNANGTLDASFGAGGVVITPFDEYGASVAIQADGKIVVAGSSSSSGQSYLDFTVVRLLPDGSLDTSFGGTGKVTTSFGNESLVRKVILQPDGKIVAVGQSNFAIYSSAFALVRYNSDGSLESGFGSGGKITHTVSSRRMYYGDAVLQPDGKIVASGGFSAPSNGLSSSIVRCNPNGSLDTSFATNGVFTAAANLHIANGIALQTDGKLVAFGSEENLNYLDYGFAILRLNPNGAPDTGFGTNGRVLTQIHLFGGGAADGAVQPDGKILAFGWTYTGNIDSDIAIVRYLGDAAVPRPVQFDFDGDRRADVSVFRPSDRVWYLNQSTNGFSATQFGLSTDRITPADYDGDGKTDIAVYRDGTWWRIDSSSSTVVAVPFGLASDIPVPADYTGDGRAELTIYRNGAWWSLNLANNQAEVVNFGLAGDKPVAADYDGDGRTDQAVYRGNGEWYLNRSSQGFAAVNFGLATDIPVVGDYDGDGKADEAVYRDGTWYLLQSSSGFAAFNWGLGTDTPAPADYDGDGRTDAAVFRNGAWYLLQSTSAISIQNFGAAGDKPVPAAYLP